MQSLLRILHLRAFQSCTVCPGTDCPIFESLLAFVTLAEEGAAPMGIEPAAAEADVIVDETNLAASISQLDMQLTWLWRVHGIDYYSGHELVEGEWPYRLTACRLIRGPCPEPGENEGPEAAAVMKQEAEEIERIVDESWKRRLTEGDPVEARCFRKRVSGWSGYAHHTYIYAYGCAQAC